MKLLITHLGRFILPRVCLHKNRNNITYVPYHSYIGARDRSTYVLFLVCCTYIFWRSERQACGIALLWGASPFPLRSPHTKKEALWYNTFGVCTIPRYWLGWQKKRFSTFLWFFFSKNDVCSRGWWNGKYLPSTITAKSLQPIHESQRRRCSFGSFPSLLLQLELS